MSLSILRLGVLRILAGAHLRRPEHISLGARVRIGLGAVLDAEGGMITVGARAWIGPEVTVLTGDPGVVRSPSGMRNAPVVIGADVWIGARAIILPGVHIGAGALVATEAVVVADVAGATIVAGTPARPVGRRGDDQCLEFAAPPARPMRAIGCESGPDAAC